MTIAQRIVETMRAKPINRKPLPPPPVVPFSERPTVLSRNPIVRMSTKHGGGGARRYL